MAPLCVNMTRKGGRCKPVFRRETHLNIPISQGSWHSSCIERDGQEAEQAVWRGTRLIFPPPGGVCKRSPLRSPPGSRSGSTPRFPRAASSVCPLAAGSRRPAKLPSRPARLLRQVAPRLTEARCLKSRLSPATLGAVGELGQTTRAGRTARPGVFASAAPAWHPSSSFFPRSLRSARVPGSMAPVKRLIYTHKNLDAFALNEGAHL
jgi:hypothetical protein